MNKSIDELAELAYKIRESEHSMGLDSYLTKNFPVNFPNKR